MQVLKKYEFSITFFTLNLDNTKIRTIFVVLKLTAFIMKKQNKTLKLTEREEELIRAIRNYRKSYPNGYPQLLYYIQQKVDELTDTL